MKSGGIAILKVSGNDVEVPDMDIDIYPMLRADSRF